ncbi:TPA: replication initiation factor domain-containing protein, partial [Staphylococcus aureus]
AYAVNCAKVLSRTDNISEIVKSILHNNLRFISPPKDGNDKNRKRWPLYRPWALFIKDTEKLNLTTRPTLKSIEDNLDWLCKQVATTLDTVLTAESMAQSEGLLTDTDFLDKILAHSQFNDEHTNRINHYLEALKQKKHLSKDKC